MIRSVLILPLYLWFKCEAVTQPHMAASEDGNDVERLVITKILSTNSINDQFHSTAFVLLHWTFQASWTSLLVSGSDASFLTKILKTLQCDKVEIICHMSKVRLCATILLHFHSSLVLIRNINNRLWRRNLLKLNKQFLAITSAPKVCNYHFGGKVTVTMKDTFN